MELKIFILTCGDYGARIVNTIAEQGFASNIVGLHEFPEDMPEFIDDFKSQVPENLPECDLILALDLKGDINMVLPEVAQKSGAKAVIAPIHDPSQIPPGLQREIIESTPDDVLVLFPKPFCSLKPVGNPVVDEFAEEFGRPELEIQTDDLVRKVKVLRGAPCGSTWYVAENLEGFPVEEAETESGNKIHNYPCLASMNTDPSLDDTILHLAGYNIKEAVKRGLGFASRSAVVLEEDCMGDVDCDHNCRDVCPQVKTGAKTITINDSGKAIIDPASCGCCEICIRECPYGAIELIEERMDI
ncbi:hypothetical protein DSECCO2_54550 [anaerobic digester metagenome]